MSKQQHITKRLDCTIAYLADYLGLRENSYDISAQVEDLRCFWYSDYQTNHNQAFFEVGHLETSFFINFQIPLEELTQDEIAMLMVRWVCFTDNKCINGSLPFTTADTSSSRSIPEVDFDVDISNGLIQPIELIFHVDQGWLQIK
jgi:hypothetical protein